ncbi:MAG: head decoration protein [Devosia sp.]|nr:head decoration protein [Devosia sp.]
MSEANFHRSRGKATIKSGSGVIEPGAILGKLTAGGKFAPSPAAETVGVEGAETAVAIAIYGCDATAADREIAIIERDAEWRIGAVVYEATVDTDTEKLAKRTQLAAVGIILRCPPPPPHRQASPPPAVTPGRARLRHRNKEHPGMSLFDDIDGSLQAAMDQVFGEAIRVLPQRVGGNYGAGAPDPARPPLDTRAIISRAPNTGKLDFAGTSRRGRSLAGAVRVLDGPGRLRRPRLCHPPRRHYRAHRQGRRARDGVQRGARRPPRHRDPLHRRSPRPMSIIALAIRMSATRALETDGATLAGARVFDSAITPLDEMVSAEPKPLIVVST